MPCSQSLAIAPKAAVECGLLYFIDPSCVLLETAGSYALSRSLCEFVNPVAFFQDPLESREKRGRIRAVECTMVEALPDHTHHARSTEVALRRRDTGGRP